MKLLNDLKILWQRVAGYISPAFIMLLCASFILWYILKLQYTYTTDYNVVVNVDGKQLRVPCVVEGKGTNLFGYQVYMQREIKIPLSDLKYAKTDVVDGLTGEVVDSLVEIDPQSMQNAISVRFSDIKVISVGDVPPIGGDNKE